MHVKWCTVMFPDWCTAIGLKSLSVMMIFLPLPIISFVCCSRDMETEPRTPKIRVVVIAGFALKLMCSRSTSYFFSLRIRLQKNFVIRISAYSCLAHLFS